MEKDADREGRKKEAAVEMEEGKPARYM